MEQVRGLRLWAALLTVWIVWGSTYLAIAITGQSIPPLLGNAIRFALAAAILAVIVAVAHGPARLRVTRRELRTSLLMGCGLLGFSIGVLALAERFVPTGIAALLIAIVPVWVILLRLATGERPRLPTVAGVLVGLIGIVLILLPGGTVPRSGDDSDVLVWMGLILVSSMTWAYLSWRAHRMALPKDSLVTTILELTGAAILLGILSPLIGERLDLSVVTSASLLGLIWLTFASVAAYSAYTWLVMRAPMSLVSTYAYINPAVAVLLGWLILQEALTADVWAGLVFILGGVALVTRGERRVRDP